ncbi:MAG: hypothetical protein ACYCSN_02370 [Acidobacteriaceae bacterium]
MEARKPTKRKPKKQVFSVTKAVKANARERVGTPPPGRVIVDEKAKAFSKPKHPPTLAQILTEEI